MAMSNSMRGYADLDFRSRFPHKLWVSDWSSSEPSGFRVKVRAVREATPDQIEVAVVLEERCGLISEVSSMHYPLSTADHAARAIVDRYALGHHLEFREVDFSSILTLDEFVGLVEHAEWLSKGAGC